MTTSDYAQWVLHVIIKNVSDCCPKLNQLSPSAIEGFQEDDTGQFSSRYLFGFAKVAFLKIDRNVCLLYNALAQSAVEWAREERRAKNYP